MQTRFRRSWSSTTSGVSSGASRRTPSRARRRTRHCLLAPSHLLTPSLLRCTADQPTLRARAGEIIVVPSCNPIGLSQVVLTSHVGRYHAARSACQLAVCALRLRLTNPIPLYTIHSGLNFNRKFPDTTAAAAAALVGKLTASSDDNAELLRRALAEAASQGTEAALRGEGGATADLALKWCLLVRSPPALLPRCQCAQSMPRLAAKRFSDISFLPPYRGWRRMRTSFWTSIATAKASCTCTRQTCAGARYGRVPAAPSPPFRRTPSGPVPERCVHSLRPEASDLAAAIKAQSVLIARDAGGDPFDDACLHPHVNVREMYPDAPFPKVHCCRSPSYPPRACRVCVSATVVACAQRLCLVFGIQLSLTPTTGQLGVLSVTIEYRGQDDVDVRATALPCNSLLSFWLCFVMNATPREHSAGTDDDDDEGTNRRPAGRGGRAGRRGARSLLGGALCFSARLCCSHVWAERFR